MVRTEFPSYHVFKLSFEMDEDKITILSRDSLEGELRFRLLIECTRCLPELCENMYDIYDIYSIHPGYNNVRRWHNRNIHHQ